MNSYDVLCGIFIMALVTFMTRCAPFYLIEKFKDHRVVDYMARMLPAGIMLILAVYSISAVDISHYPYGLAEILSIMFICGLHIYKRSLVISLTSGIIFYTIVFQLIPLA